MAVYQGARRTGGLALPWLRPEVPRRASRELRDTRDDVAMPMDDELDDTGPTGLSDRFSFLDPRSPSLRFALGD